MTGKYRRGAAIPPDSRKAEKDDCFCFFYSKLLNQSFNRSLYPGCSISTDYHPFYFSFHMPRMQLYCWQLLEEIQRA